MTIFLAGGTGKTGGRVAARLTNARIGSRQGTPAFDWARPETYAAAIGDADIAYVAYAPDLAVPQAEEHLGEFTRVAVGQGVRRLVLLSGRGEPEAQAAERAMFALAPESTVLRASWLDQNFSEGNFADMVRAGEVAVPVGAVGEPFVDADDVADAAVAALLEPGHEGQVYELTGPRLLTFADAVDEIAAAAGREISFTTIPMDVFERSLAADGLPPDLLDLLRYLFTQLFDGRNARLGKGVQQLLGREPRDFRAFARAVAW
jgi:uncharacterized protein YbjT (DUF2867 family)